MSKSYVNYKATVGLRHGEREVLRAKIALDGLPESSTLFGKSNISDAMRAAVHSKFAPQLLSAINRFRIDEDAHDLKRIVVEVEGTSNLEGKSTTVDDGESYSWQATDPRCSFDRLVLPGETLRLFDDAIASVAASTKVFQQWGLSQNYGGKRPACVLNFFGPPGTGKTASAHALAEKLRTKILVAQYSQLESKYVGESAKNLDLLFAAAEASGAVLLFDEADVLLGKRVSAQSSSDHALNAMRTTMLLWLDRFSGVCVLATNNRDSYDKAFDRRILFDVPFALPSAEQTRSILQRHLPATLPLTEDATVDAVSKLMEGLSGADIRDTILRAALSGAQRGKTSLDVSDFSAAADLIRGARRSTSADTWMAERIASTSGKVVQSDA